jgi:hypothetical protein
LVFHRRLGPKQSQEKTAVEKQQTLDFTLAIVGALPGVDIFKEERHRDIEGRGNLLQASSANPVNAFLVFLHLLEADAKHVGKLRLLFCSTRRSLRRLPSLMSYLPLDRALMMPFNFFLPVLTMLSLAVLAMVLASHFP